MKSIAISLQGNNFFVKDHRWRFTESRLEYMAQKVRHAISIFLGEWFFNQTIGIPYIPKQDDNKITHRRLLETRLQTTITGVKGIEKLVSFTSELDKSTRAISVHFVAQIDSGETFEQDFVI